MRRKPFSVVLFDEVEKAHPDIFNSLLQILEDGRLTDSQGRVVDFKNTVIIMTTNLGTRDISKGFNLGFAAQGDAKTDYERMKAKVSDELKQHFRPEFLNRVDDIVVFHAAHRGRHHPDRRPDDRQGGRAPARTGTWASSSARTAKELLAKKGYDPVLGARPLRRTIQREIEDTLSEKILFGELRPGHIVVVDTEGEGDDARPSPSAARRSRAAPRDAPPIEAGDGHQAPTEQPAQHDERGAGPSSTARPPVCRGACRALRPGRA